MEELAAGGPREGVWWTECVGPGGRGSGGLSVLVLEGGGPLCQQSSHCVTTGVGLAVRTRRTFTPFLGRLYFPFL